MARGKTATEYGRGTGVPHPVDVYVGRRVRERRIYLGMNQEELARRLGLTFQQIQKYEAGANRVSASRLAKMVDILEVSTVDFFFLGFSEKHSPVLAQQPVDTEAIDLIRSYNLIEDDEVKAQFALFVATLARRPS